MEYFSDGCAAQYKNRYNFANLCMHMQDFGLNAEWNFFATAHGKSPCDGIGGIVKRATAVESLKRTRINQIMTPEEMYKFCQNCFTKFLSITSKRAKLKLVVNFYSLDLHMQGESQEHAVSIDSNYVACMHDTKWWIG